MMHAPVGVTHDREMVPSVRIDIAFPVENVVACSRTEIPVPSSTRRRAFRRGCGWKRTRPREPSTCGPILESKPHLQTERSFHAIAAVAVTLDEDGGRAVEPNGDVRHIDLGQPPEAQFYESTAERLWGMMTVVTRTRAEFNPFIASARQLVHPIDPEVSLFGVETLDAMARRSAARPRFNVVVFTIFASVGLALAVVGIYGFCPS